MLDLSFSFADYKRHEKLIELYGKFNYLFISVQLFLLEPLRRKKGVLPAFGTDSFKHRDSMDSFFGISVCSSKLKPVNREIVVS